MLQNLRSYFARSGGLLLLILAFAIVAVLAVLTINAAKDGAKEVVDNTPEVTAPIVGEVTEDKDDTEVIDLSDEDESDETDVDTDDTTDADESDTSTETTDADEAETSTTDVDDEDEDEAVAAATDSDEDKPLPSTGPAESAMIAAAAIAILAFVSSKYVDSRNQLAQSIRR